MVKVYYPGIGESRLSMVRRKKEDKNPFGDVDGSRNLELEALKIKRREVNPWKGGGLSWGVSSPPL